MNRLKNNILRTIPVCTGYVVLGMGFGILLRSKGFGAIWAAAMSIFIYAGSMQYVALDLLTAGASIITVAITTLMVNARHLFYGISMIDRYKDTGRAKPYLIFGLTDETYSLICGDKELTRTDMLQITLLDQLYWVAGSIAGSLLGSMLDLDIKGIDFALTALFATILVDQWLDTRDHLPALTGMISTLLCLIIFGKDGFLIPSMILITAVLTIQKYITEIRSRREHRKQ